MIHLRTSAQRVRSSTHCDVNVVQCTRSCFWYRGDLVTCVLVCITIYYVSGLFCSRVKASFSTYSDVDCPYMECPKTMYFSGISNNSAL